MVGSSNIILSGVPPMVSNTRSNRACCRRLRLAIASTGLSEMRMSNGIIRVSRSNGFALGVDRGRRIVGTCSGTKGRATTVAMLIARGIVPRANSDSGVTL